MKGKKSSWSGLFYFMESFLCGLTAPVISLILLSHGANIGTLSLFIGLYSASVILFEIPSGMFADMYGRKMVFLLAHFFLCLNYLLLLNSEGVVRLTLACVCWGIGRAFSSGSLEALIVEEAISQGDDNLSKTNSQLLILNCAGSAVGAILGGMLGTIGKDYNLLLLVLVLLEGLLFASSGILLKESKQRPFSAELGSQLTMMKDAWYVSGTIRMLLIMALLFGSVVAVLETYWQHNLLLLLPEKMGWILGIISCLGYAGAMIGSKVGERIQTGRGFWIFRICFPVVILILGICNQWTVFIGFYAAAYIVWGAGDLCERTLLHVEVENEYRASILSVQSLFVKAGCIFSAVMANWIVNLVSLRAVWILIPLLACAVSFFLMCRQGEKCRQNKKRTE